MEFLLSNIQTNDEDFKIFLEDQNIFGRFQCFFYVSEFTLIIHIEFCSSKWDVFRNCYW